MKPLSIERVIQLLEEFADDDSCDGDCDKPPTYERCNSCRASHILNDSAEILRTELRCILKSTHYEGNWI